MFLGLARCRASADRGVTSAHLVCPTASDPAQPAASHMQGRGKCKFFCSATLVRRTTAQPRLSKDRTARWGISTAYPCMRVFGPLEITDVVLHRRLYQRHTSRIPATIGRCDAMHSGTPTTHRHLTDKPVPFDPPRAQLMLTSAIEQFRVGEQTKTATRACRARAECRRILSCILLHTASIPHKVRAPWRVSACQLDAAESTRFVSHGRLPRTQHSIVPGQQRVMCFVTPSSCLSQLCVYAYFMAVACHLQQPFSWHGFIPTLSPRSSYHASGMTSGSWHLAGLLRQRCCLPSGSIPLGDMTRARQRGSAHWTCRGSEICIYFSANLALSCARSHCMTIFGQAITALIGMAEDRRACCKPTK